MSSPCASPSKAVESATPSLLHPERVRRELARLLTPAPRVTADAGLFFGPPRPLVESAVLMALLEREGRFHLLLTRRALHLRKHRGEMSFPGGRRDPEDASTLASALREAQEEVSISPQDLTLMGHFADVPTITGFRIDAYLAELHEERVLKPNPDEIAYTRLIALQDFVAPGAHHVVMKQHAGMAYPIHVYAVDEQPVWGATAFMIYELLVALGVQH